MGPGQKLGDQVGGCCRGPGEGGEGRVEVGEDLNSGAALQSRASQIGRLIEY